VYDFFFYPITLLDRPLGLQEVEASRISRQHMKVTVVTAIHWMLLPPSGNPWHSFLLEAESSQSHSVARRIKSMKNPIDPIRNQDPLHSGLQCSAVYGII
jgi:hypothetical protein